jgi:hypothetical protein
MNPDERYLSKEHKYLSIIRKLKTESVPRLCEIYRKNNGLFYFIRAFLKFLLIMA